MAGRGAIQFLRGDSSKRKASNESLLPGQPFYETDTNLLYVGGKEGTPLKTAAPAGRTIQTYWENVGQDKAVRVRPGDRAFIELKDGTVLPALCVNSEAWDLRSQKGGIIWQVVWTQRHAMLSQGQFESTGVQNWGDTDLHKWLRDTVLPLFPDYLSTEIISVTKSSGTDHGDSGTSCKLWVPSAEEIWGKNNTSLPSTTEMCRDDKATQFQYYAQLIGTDANSKNSDLKLTGDQGTWLRNKKQGATFIKLSTQWYVLTDNGKLGTDGGNESYSVTFCFIL